MMALSCPGKRTGKKNQEKEPGKKNQGKEPGKQNQGN
jgi:hypothetical protein